MIPSKRQALVVAGLSVLAWCSACTSPPGEDDEKTKDDVQPTSPTVIATATWPTLEDGRTSGSPTEVQLGPDDVVYVLTGDSPGHRDLGPLEAGLDVYSFDGSSELLLIAQIALPETAHAAWLENAHLFIVDWHSTLRVFDVTTPSSPVEVAQLKVSNSGTTLVGDGAGHLFSINQKNLDVVDVYRPSEPELVTTVTLPIYPKSVHFEAGTLFMSQAPGTLAVWDVSAPEAPVEVAQVEGIGSELVYNSRGMMKVDDRLWIPGEDQGLFVFDVSKIDAPAFDGVFLDDEAWSAVSPASHLPIGFPESGAILLDVTAPNAPEIEPESGFGYARRPRVDILGCRAAFTSQGAQARVVLVDGNCQ